MLFLFGITLKRAVALLPKAVRDFLGLCFYFWSNEGGDNREPIHVHISKGKPTANATKKPPAAMESGGFSYSL